MGFNSFPQIKLNYARLLVILICYKHASTVSTVIVIRISLHSLISRREKEEWWASGPNKS